MYGGVPSGCPSGSSQEALIFKIRSDTSSERNVVVKPQVDKTVDDAPDVFLNGVNRVYLVHVPRVGADMFQATM